MWVGFLVTEEGFLWMQDEKNVRYSKADAQELHNAEMKEFSNLLTKQSSIQISCTNLPFI